MSSKKTIFIIPGYRHGPKNKAYQSLAQILKGEGYDPILVAIPWKKSTLSENTEYFLKAYRKVKTKKKYILGFSFGAMIAFVAATKVTVNGLILCSLSPYFQEDVTKVTLRLRSGREKSSLSPLQTDRRQDFLTFHSETLAKQVKAEQILMLYGAQEARSLINRVKQTYADILATQKSLFSIKNTDHNINDRKYLQTIHSVAKTLQ